MYVQVVTLSVGLNTVSCLQLMLTCYRDLNTLPQVCVACEYRIELVACSLSQLLNVLCMLSFAPILWILWSILWFPVEPRCSAFYGHVFQLLRNRYIHLLKRYYTPIIFSLSKLHAAQNQLSLQDNETISSGITACLSRCAAIKSWSSLSNTAESRGELLASLQLELHSPSSSTSSPPPISLSSDPPFVTTSSDEPLTQACQSL